MIREEKRIGPCSVEERDFWSRKYVRGTDRFIDSVICSMYVYTLHMTIDQGCIFMREKEKFDSYHSKRNCH